MIATCPEDKTTSDFGHYTHKNGKSKRFFFPAETCCGCPHKAECLRAVDKQAGRGRSVELHPQEGLLQVARAHQASGAFREDIKARQVVEHRFANLARLGMRQARYIGRKKTKYQMLMLAMILNIKVVGGMLPLDVPLSTQPYLHSIVLAMEKEKESAAKVFPAERNLQCSGSSNRSPWYRLLNSRGFRSHFKTEH